MNKRKVYVVPEVRIVEVCQENLMNNPTSWDDGSGNKQPIVEGNPDAGRTHQNAFASKSFDR
nr:hypothetical protein [Prevotella sp.]